MNTAEPSVTDIPLFVASQKDRNDTVKLLHMHGASVDNVAHQGVAPLSCVCRSGHLDVVKFFLEHGASMDLVRDD